MLDILPEAEAEIEDAFRYYERSSPKAAKDFLDEYRRGVNKILEAPTRWPKTTSGLRQYRLDRFPYGLIYRLHADGNGTIESVFHLHREPESWRRDR